jgi:integrase
MLMTLYSTGVRRAELCQLKVEDIDGDRMIIHIRQGKGGKDRDVPLDPKLRENAPGILPVDEAQNVSIPPHRARLARRQAHHSQSSLERVPGSVQRAGITKRVSPHLVF